MAFVTEDNITDLAVTRWATAQSPRLAQLMTALVRHIHDYAREVELTAEEWMTAIEWLTATGQISTDKRQEFILASDVVGLSMLVVQLNNRFAEEATPATVLGPFHIDGSPPAPFGHDMSDGIPGTPLFITGTVTDTAGTPIPGAVLDVWQADADGTYEAQMPEIDEARLRAKYQARQDGTYCVRTIAPLGYTIPMDGPVGDLITKTEISEYRPAHVHFLFEEPDYRKLITHLFQQGADYLDTDVVFGVKDALIVPFVEHDPGLSPDGKVTDEPFLVAHYDFVLEPTI
ncbi:hydroxyquinol 1,2-dioxygenase [Antrihabitans sp. YC3-6]|uniref:Hydroxyquinol 1,2-dioxygenase n=1 Tax=Antrihabitans stalagmiti TaxID=2799499 RepID=A0A934U443_9NOCA|nr:dioxygenase [Antrihabitans stalagmiti]MBJ8339453.1 hydroxyquinol 1,2-dioxygenase [Antrihabitans stalagmiti]